MDLKSNHSSPVLADTAPLNKSRLGLRSSLQTRPAPSPALTSGLHLMVPRKKTGVLDDVRYSVCLDAMKSSSPPPKLITISDDIAYQTWMMKYPSALLSFEQFASFTEGKRITLFLDYDGTLSPIVDNPDCAFMTDPMRASVRMAAKCFPTAIISGRSRDKVFEFVQLTELYYAGSHGMDIIGPVRDSSEDGLDLIRSNDKQDKEESLFQPASRFLKMIEEVSVLLVETTKGIAGVKVESNKFCVSVHYRNVDVDEWGEVGSLVSRIVENYSHLRLTHGRKVLEVRPVIDWDKGKAVTFILESLGLDKCDDVLPIYIGDDRTDEDAFKILREDKRGCGIIVSSAPKESNAYYSLRDPSEVMEFLKLLVAHCDRQEVTK
ncbi:hypothetical protein MLD38_030344 [Melastoma candidum]|uniref:Uncharacterized protein n=1 Tax=Melastoma candidum TaxID=119954 RepID=A0ACB9MPZ5_9MYRT|nr:hypothetical protein MLD38_030344 [Melastoma candidum]